MICRSSINPPLARSNALKEYRRIVVAVKIAMYYESKSGNNQKIIERLRELLAARGNQVEAQRISDVDPKAIAPADLYVFSSPTMMGKPVRSMRKFLKKAQLSPGAKYALIATHLAVRPDKKTGKMPTEEETAKWQRTLPVMSELLEGKGTKVSEEKIYVKDMKGPLEDDWEKKVSSLADRFG